MNAPCNGFHTYCMAYRKRYLVLIDLGCCEIMITKETVDKLNIICEKYPTVYNVSWLKKGVKF